jgi:hypothetical protein
MLAPRACASHQGVTRKFRRNLGLKAGINAGEIPDQHAELSSAALIGAIAEALVGPISPAGPTHNDEEIVSSLITFCRQALGIR